MTSPKLLLPIRVPELGPSLGRVLTGTGPAAAGPPLDACRLQALSRLFEASGEARRLAAEGERARALGALDAQIWLDAWEEAVKGVAAALIVHVNARLAAEASAARMPRRLRRSVPLDAAEERGISGRLGAVGAGLVPALDALHERTERLRGATAAEREALDEWQETLLVAARRFEAAWLGLADQAAAELERWAEVAAGIARWRRPLWPVAAVGIPALAAAALLGLVMGGYLPAPGWLVALWARLP
jgi:hypothetical protein